MYIYATPDNLLITNNLSAQCEGSNLYGYPHNYIDEPWNPNDFVAFGDGPQGPDAVPSPPPPGVSDDCLGAFDFNIDADIDVADFSGFQRLFGG